MSAHRARSAIAHHHLLSNVGESLQFSRNSVTLSLAVNPVHVRQLCPSRHCPTWLPAFLGREPWSEWADSWRGSSVSSQSTWQYSFLLGSLRGAGRTVEGQGVEEGGWVQAPCSVHSSHQRTSRPAPKALCSYPARVMGPVAGDQVLKNPALLIGINVPYREGPERYVIPCT